MKLLIPVILLVLSLSPAFGQKIIIEQTPTSQTISIPNAPTISENEWKILVDSLNTENWNTSVFYSAGLLKRLKIDNEAKQLARLRYFYLYSLAGQILKAHDAKKTEDERASWKELNKVAESLIGKEFVLPPREFRGGCERALNFVCSVPDNPKAFRTTAVNKEASGIHSFDYIVFQNEIDLRGYLSKQIFLGGTLKKVEFNEALSATQPWVMYLVFEKGFVRVVDGQ